MKQAIETVGLTKHYPGGIIGVEELNLSVKHGEIYGFLGSNGAGKTTTIRMLLNLLYPTAGHATILGMDVVKKHVDICRKIAYLPSSIRPHKHLSGEDFLSYMGKLSGNGDREYRYRLLDRFEFSRKDLKRKIKAYSSGMARKIALIQTFQNRPKLVIMDEPTEGLDPVMQHIFYELLKAFRADGGTVFLSSHHLLEVEQVCDRAGIVRKGRLIAVEKIEHIMKHMSRTISIRFKQDAGELDLGHHGWEIETISGRHLTAKIIGPIDDLIKFISRFDVSDLSMPNPSLQDVFLDYYRNGNDAGSDPSLGPEKNKGA